MTRQEQQEIMQNNSQTRLSVMIDNEKQQQTTTTDFNRLKRIRSAEMSSNTNSRHKSGTGSRQLPTSNLQSISHPCYTCCCSSNNRKRSSRQNLFINNRSPALLLVVVVAILCSSTTFLPQISSSAVVRPTIFKSDSDSPAPVSPNSPQVSAATAASSQAATAASTGQQPVQQQQQQSTQIQHHFMGLQADAAAQAHQQLVPSNKVNPIKSRFCASSNGLRLDSPLGLESFAIDDLSLSASSFSNEQVRPHLARLNRDISGGAWCPMKPISSSNFGKEWIQVKLNRSFVISAIETQGRFAMGSGKEFVPSYSVEYSRNNGLTWHKWKDFRGLTLLKANDDVNSPARNELSPPIVGANVIRIVPFSQHLRTVCLRFELFGCQYDEGAPIAYSMTDGVVESRWGFLIDYTYDGLRQLGHLANGLGQLVDGVKGPDNFSFNSGFEWIGWKSMNGDVVIEFTFKTLRNFTGALFHSNNLFSNGVEVFQGVDVHYGIDVNLSFDHLKDSLWEQRRRELAISGAAAVAAPSPLRADQQQPQQTLWSADTMSIEYEPDKKVESSRPVTVHLKQRLANKLRFVLKFASKWILVSEVEFLSHPIELMSLASLNEQLTPPLIGALAPAKTYDEYVAILREHQLRRIATDAYLESFSSTSAGVTTQSSTTSGDLNDQQQQQTAVDSSSPVAVEQPKPLDDYFNDQTNKRVSGPTIPSVNLNQWPPQPQPEYPATNPQFNPPVYQPAQPSFISQPQDLQQQQTGPNKVDLIQMSGDQQQQQQRHQTFGLAALVSFVFVAILVFLGLLFAISSYRLRHQPKLGSTQLQRQWCGPAKGFMSNVLASSDHHHHQHNHLNLQQQHIVDHQSSASDSHYNPLFANSGQSSDGSLKNNMHTSSGPLSTLKRLATLTSGGSSNKQQANLLFNTTGGQHHQQHANQLLVSLKDPSSLQNKPNQQQSINTQLIVGLNQANPLAQQQIYNSQQTYATHYSTSMSMASGSSTNGGQQGDYSGPDYAIPDGQPIINPASNQRTLGPLFGSASNEQHHFNQAFTHHRNQCNPKDLALQRQLQLITPTQNGSSFRANNRFMAHQQQQQQQRGPLVSEHNYELIDGGDQQASFAATSQRNQMPSIVPMIHQRTLSNNQQISSYNNNNNSNQLQCQTFNSMTLNSNQLLRARQQQQQVLSPNGSASGQTTSSSSANSTSPPNAANDGGLTSSHYYYSSTEAAKSCQLDKK